MNEMVKLTNAETKLYMTLRGFIGEGLYGQYKITGEAKEVFGCERLAETVVLDFAIPALKLGFSLDEQGTCPRIPAGYTVMSVLPADLGSPKLAARIERLIEMSKASL